MWVASLWKASDPLHISLSHLEALAEIFHGQVVTSRLAGLTGLFM